MKNNDRDSFIIIEYKEVIDAATYNMRDIITKWDITKHAHTLLNGLKNVSYTNFYPLDYAFEHTVDGLLEFDEEFKSIKLTDDMKKWVIREAHDTFDYEEWESHIKKAIRWTLKHYTES